MEDKRDIHYKAFYLVDTSFDFSLDGRYEIEEYVLLPCLKTERNSILGCSSFVLGFDFQGINEKGFNSDEKVPPYLINSDIASLKAKTFLAWMVCATRRFARLPYFTLGGRMTGGPCTHMLSEEFDETKLSVFHIDKSAKEGEFVILKRPNLKETISYTHKSHSLKLPSDFPMLTKKIFSLRKDQREKFINACFAYQFALENRSSYPTVSILALVSAIESMMTRAYTSKFCDDAKRACRLKSDVMKKFRMFFEQTLTNPLPSEERRFLNRIYRRRSLFVHEALLGEPGGIRGVFHSYHSEESQRLMTELQNLENLVNAGILQWLIKI